MWTCPNCGANLDNGERCDCENEDRNEADHRIQADVVRYKPCRACGGNADVRTDFRNTPCPAGHIHFERTARVG